MEQFRPFLGQLYCKFMEIMGLKAPGSYSASIWSYNFSICLWEIPKTIMFMISVLLNGSPSPKTIYFHLWRPQDTSKRSKKIPNYFDAFMVMIFTILKIQNVDFSKRWASKNPDDPSNNILKILDMRSVSIKQHEMHIW